MKRRNIVLSGVKNYNAWAHCLEAVLKQKKLWFCVTTKNLSPKFADKDDLALSCIKSAIKRSLNPIIENSKTSYRAWTALQTTFQKKTLIKTIHLYRKLFHSKYNAFYSPHKYFNKIRSVERQLHSLGEAIDDKFLAIIILTGLPTKFNQMVQLIDDSGQKLSTSLVMSSLYQDCERFSSFAPVSCSKDRIENASCEKNTNKKCFNCGSIWHIRLDCPQLSRRKRSYERSAFTLLLRSVTAIENSLIIVKKGTTSEESLSVMQNKDQVSPVNSSLFIESLIEQFCRLLEKNPRKQRKMYFTICGQLRDLRLIGDSYLYEELAQFRGHYRQAFTYLLTNPNVEKPLLFTSRYHTDYTEICLIAKGGFGQVFKARHCLDQMDYAVKKIKESYKGQKTFIETVQEVKTLARLNHYNIVQYKAAWFEAESYTNHDRKQICDASSSDYSEVVVFKKASDDASSGEPDGPVCAYKPIPRNNMSEVGVMYITMELCDKTLRDWLLDMNENGVELKMEQAMDMIIQAANGLKYIHDNNVTHHDIKPRNIFVSKDMRVQVGDFGLACSLPGSCSVNADQQGTRLYAAPEQLRGKCNRKCDLFSIGLVFLEILLPIKTDMERANVLKSAREGILPSDLPYSIKPLLSDLLASEPDSRPNANELVERLMLLKKESAEDIKDSTIINLRKLLAEKDLEIGQLKRQIEILSFSQCVSCKQTDPPDASPERSPQVELLED